MPKSAVKKPETAKSGLKSTTSIPAADPALVAALVTEEQAPPVDAAIEAEAPVSMEAPFLAELAAVCEPEMVEAPEMIAEPAIEAVPIAFTEALAGEPVEPVEPAQETEAELPAQATPAAVTEAVAAEMVGADASPALAAASVHELQEPRPIATATPQYSFGVLLKSCEMWSTAFNEASKIAAESVRTQFETNQALWKAAQDVRSVRDVVDLTTLIARSRSEVMAENGRQVFALIRLIEQSWSPITARETKAA